MTTDMLIPKIIHYCWFGGKHMPKLARKCIKSWKKHCKGYKFIEWNEKNFSIQSSPQYVKEAYKMKKYAFVTDYVRLYVLLKYGGIYMDTDVEVIKPLDPFLSLQAFSGFESINFVPTGIMASIKNFPLFKEFIDYYNTKRFCDEFGNPSSVTNTSIITEIMKQHGITFNNKKQTVDGFTIFPKEYFCPLSWDTRKLKKTDCTYTIHWFAGSWRSKSKKIKMSIKRGVKHILGNRLTSWIKRNILK